MTTSNDPLSVASGTRLNTLLRESFFSQCVGGDT